MIGVLLPSCFAPTFFHSRLCCKRRQSVSLEKEVGRGPAGHGSLSRPSGVRPSHLPCLVQCVCRSSRGRVDDGDDRHPLDRRQKITQRAPTIGIEPSPTPVFRRVVDHAAPLAERREVARRVVSRIMVEMRARNIHAHDRCDACAGRARSPPPPVAPMPELPRPAPAEFVRLGRVATGDRHGFPCGGSVRQS